MLFKLNVVVHKLGRKCHFRRGIFSSNFVSVFFLNLPFWGLGKPSKGSSQNAKASAKGKRKRQVHIAITLYESCTTCNAMQSRETSQFFSLASFCALSMGIAKKGKESCSRHLALIDHGTTPWHAMHVYERDGPIVLVCLELWSDSYSVFFFFC